MDARFDQVDAQFTQVARLDQVDARFAQVDERLAHVDARLASVETRIDATAVETRRHFDVVAEQLRSDIALFASGGAVTKSRLDHSLVENESTQKTLFGALDDHERRLRILQRSR